MSSWSSYNKLLKKYGGSPEVARVVWQKLKGSTTGHPWIARALAGEAIERSNKWPLGEEGMTLGDLVDTVSAMFQVSINHLPAKVRLYRGVKADAVSSEARRKLTSWTTKKEVANRFAQIRSKRPGKVFTAEVPSKHILLHPDLLSVEGVMGEESEVLVYNYSPPRLAEQRIWSVMPVVPARASQLIQSILEGSKASEIVDSLSEAIAEPVPKSRLSAMKFKLHSADASTHKLYEVDVASFDQAWKTGDPSAYVGRGKSAIADRYQRFEKWLDGGLEIRGQDRSRKSGESIIAPVVGFQRNTNGVVTAWIDDGRHRYAVLRDRGERVVVATRPEFAEIGIKAGILRKPVVEHSVIMSEEEIEVLIDLLMERTRVDPVVLYHGTSSKKWEKIRSEGFRPDVDQVWAEDPQAGGSNISRVSLQGTYFTSNVLTAYSSAGRAVDKFGGNRVIIAAQIQLLSSVVDEDELKFGFNSAFISALGGVDHEGIIGWFWAAYKAGWPPKGSYEEPLKADSIFVDRALGVIARDLKEEPAPQLRSHLTPILRDYFFALLEWRVASSSSKRQISQSIYEVANAMTADRSRDWREDRTDQERADSAKLEDELNKSILSKSQAESLLTRHLDRISVAVRSVGRVRNPGGSMEPNIRVTDPITFRGRNKIIAAVEFFGSFGESVKRLYRKMPQEFERKWKERVGNLNYVD